MALYSQDSNSLHRVLGILKGVYHGCNVSTLAAKARLEYMEIVEYTFQFTSTCSHVVCVAT